MLIGREMKSLTAVFLAFLTNDAVGSIIDAVRVEKSERKMYLHSGDQIVRSYEISLGDSPRGHKTTEGDERTPEGTYVLNWRNPNSRYHLSIQISYPNDADIRQARERGVSPGGEIFIHGLPNGTRSRNRLPSRKDWTDGCIAVKSNQEMEEIWTLVPLGTPITINP